MINDERLRVVRAGSSKGAEPKEQDFPSLTNLNIQNPGQH